MAAARKVSAAATVTLFFCETNQFGHGRLVQDVLQDVFEKVGDVVFVLDLVPDRLFLDLFNDFLRRRNTDVRGDEDLFELVVEGVADLVLQEELAKF